MPRRNSVSIDAEYMAHFDGIFALMEEAGTKNPPAPAQQLPPPIDLKEATAPAAQARHVLQSNPDSYEGMTRAERLFKAIELGDKETIRNTMQARYVPNKDGTESRALIQSALSLVPQGKHEAHHFPEPLLHRAARSQQTASMMQLANLGLDLPRQEQEAFFNAKREIDGATVLHELAASVPAEKRIRLFSPDRGEWRPDKLIPLFIACGTDVFAKDSDGHTAADLAPNATIKKLLQEAMDKAMQEDAQHAANWQARRARAYAAEGNHLKRVR